MRFEILKGLPPYGPMAVPFPDARGSHSEGFVVRFEPDTGEAWVGNFQWGIGSWEGAFVHPNGRHVVVVSRGQLYVVDAASRRLDETVPPLCVQDVMPLPDLNAIVFSDGVQFAAINSTGSWWRSPRISWDGFRNVRREGMTLRGEAFTPVARGDSAWVPFTLDLESGACSDGIYEKQMRGAIRVLPETSNRR